LWTPSVSGAATAALAFADNASGSPQSVALSGTGTHDVVLSWSASTTSGVTGYYVYRGTTSGAESSTPLNASLVTSTSYIDATVQAGQTYYYVVSAVAADGTTTSVWSNEATATVPSS
jgi:fibronectin type 3 domain-containing protein